MDIAAKAISSRLLEMERNRDLLALDIQTLTDARQFIVHLVERIEELENPIGPPGDEDVQIPPRHSEQAVVNFIQGHYRPPRIVNNPED